MIYDLFDTAFSAATTEADPEAAYKRAPLWEINHNDSPALKNVFFALPVTVIESEVKTGIKKKVVVNIMFLHVHLLTDDQALRDPKLRTMYTIMMAFYNALDQFDDTTIQNKRIRYEDVINFLDPNLCGWSAVIEFEYISC